MATKANEALFRKKILGILSADEELLFEQLCSENSDFQDEYLAYREIMEAVIMAENENLKQRLRNLNRSQKKGFKAWLPIAASFALLIGITSILYFNGKADVYDDYFEVYPNVMLPTTREGHNPVSELQKAFFYYDQREYLDAISGFEKYLKNHNDANVSFYNAMALMQLKRLKEAKEILESIPIENKSFDYVGETRWYLALMYIKEGNGLDALELLKSNKLEGLSFKAGETDELLMLIRNSD